MEKVTLDLSDPPMTALYAVYGLALISGTMLEKNLWILLLVTDRIKLDKNVTFSDQEFEYFFEDIKNGQWESC